MRKTNRSSFAARLVRTRVAAGYHTQRSACAKFGWQEATVRVHEAGHRMPGPDMASKYADAYGVTIEDLFGNEAAAAAKRWTRKARTDGVQSAEEARALYHYDPVTGIITRRVNISNSKAGTVIGSANRGYLTVRAFGKNHKAHRLAWLLMMGEWPPGVVDHVNGDGMDNRWCNLRLATRSQNQANSKRPKSNRSGIKGVWWDRRRNRWIASISVKNRNTRIGAFHTAEEAAAAYQAEATRLFGDFARFE